VCASNKWAANSTYCEVCLNLDASCKAAQCSSGEDGCCLEKQDSACDLDCEFGKDIDVIMANASGKYEINKISELLPKAFSF